MVKILYIDGMTCSHCSAAVKKSLEKIEGCEKAEVILEQNKAVVTMAGEIDELTLARAVEEAGYRLTKIENK